MYRHAFGQNKHYAECLGFQNGLSRLLGSIPLFSVQKKHGYGFKTGYLKHLIELVTSDRYRLSRAVVPLVGAHQPTCQCESGGGLVQRDLATLHP